MTIGEDHQSDREPEERREVRPKIAARRLRRSAEQEGRQEDQQDEVGLELEGRQARYEGEPESAEHEQGRKWHTDPTGDLEQDRDGDEDAEDRGQDVHVTATISIRGQSRAAE